MRGQTSFAFKFTSKRSLLRELHEDHIRVLHEEASPVRIHKMSLSPVKPFRTLLDALLDVLFILLIYQRLLPELIYTLKRGCFSWSGIF
jgi:hypothetical protein